MANPTQWILFNGVVVQVIPGSGSGFVANSGLWHSTGGTLDAIGYIGGSAGQFLVTNAGISDTTWVSLSNDLLASGATPGSVAVVALSGTGGSLPLRGSSLALNWLAGNVTLNAVGTTVVQIGGNTSTDFVALGATPATTGNVRLANGGSIVSRNHTSASADVALLATDALNNVIVGDSVNSNKVEIISGSGSVTIGPSGVLAAGFSATQVTLFQPLVVTTVASLAGTSGDFIQLGVVTSTPSGFIRVPQSSKILAIAGNSLISTGANNTDLLLAQGSFNIQPSGPSITVGIRQMVWEGSIGGGPTLSQDGSGGPPQGFNFTIQPSQGSTGGGNLIASLMTPAGGSEAFLEIDRGATPQLYIGTLVGSSGANSGLYFGGVTPGASNWAFRMTSTITQVQAPSAVSLTIGGSNILTAGASTLTINQPLVLTSQTTATSASAGSNGAVPLQVVGYITISINGANQKIPYFGV